MNPKFLLMAMSAALIGVSGTVMSAPRTDGLPDHVLDSRQSNCGYGAGNNQNKDDWQGVDRAGPKNLGETDGGTVPGEKPDQPYNELDPGKAGCGAGEYVPS